MKKIGKFIGYVFPKLKLNCADKLVDIFAPLDL